MQTLMAYEIRHTYAPEIRIKLIEQNVWLSDSHNVKTWGVTLAKVPFYYYFHSFYECSAAYLYSSIYMGIVELCSGAVSQNMKGCLKSHPLFV